MDEKSGVKAAAPVAVMPKQKKPVARAGNVLVGCRHAIRSILWALRSQPSGCDPALLVCGGKTWYSVAGLVGAWLYWVWRVDDLFHCFGAN